MAKANSRAMRVALDDDDQLYLLRKANSSLRRDLATTRDRLEVLKFERNNFRATIYELLECARNAHDGQIAALTIRAVIARGLSLRSWKLDPESDGPSAVPKF